MTWQETDCKYDDFQESCFRDSDTGNVLAIEQTPEAAPWDHRDMELQYQVVLLPPDYGENAEVLEYFAKDVPRGEAIQTAKEIVENDITKASDA